MAERRPTLEQLLTDIPIGVSATTVSGERLYANNAADTCRDLPPSGDVELEGRTLRRASFTTHPDAGEPVEIVITTDVTADKAQETQLLKRAFFDELTELPNRVLLQQTVDDAVRTAPDQGFALAFIDLDGFKHINDYYGHRVGDEILLLVARRLTQELGRNDLLSRMGGDEFVMLIASPDMHTLGGMAERILRRLKEPFFVEGHEIFTSASIGVSVYPRDGASYDSLCANADSAMYRVKKSSKGAVQFFDSSAAPVRSELARSEQQLRLVVRDHRLCCAYQPKVDFRSGETKGVEVLLRWRDEDGVVHSAGDLVTVAVDLGLMEEITSFVLHETIGAIPELDAAFGGDTSISINIAARQAGDPIFMRSLLRTLEKTGAASRFMLELTEEAFLATDRFQSDVLPLVREAGARVSIDDFGVGYSSLAKLADITADELKVDRSFITSIHRRPRSQSVLRAIESMATALGMSVVVEGVETADELAYLMAASRIRVAQGFYFARPLLLEEMGSQIAGQSRHSVGRETATGRATVARAPLQARSA